MRSGYLLFALPVFLVAAPAMAQDVVFVSGTGENYSAPEYDGAPMAESYDEDFSDIAGKISDPAVQDGVAAVVERATGAMMNMPIGQFAEAIERARPGTVNRRIRRDATIADIAGRDARYLPEELGERSRDAMGMMSGFARAMATMMPEFERMSREMEESFRAAKAEARRSKN